MLSRFAIKLLLRAGVTLAVFLASWAFIFLFQMFLVPPNAVQEFLIEKFDWLRLLDPAFSRLVLDQWQFLLALLLTLAFLPFSGKLAELLSDFLLSKARLSLILSGATLVGSKAELLWFLPSDSLTILLSLKNTGYASINIDRLRLGLGVYQRVRNADIIVSFLSVQGTNPNEMGLDWESVPEQRYEIRRSITLGPAEELSLPTILLQGTEIEKPGEPNVSFLVGNPNLELKLSLTVTVGTKAIDLTIDAPLRVFLKIDEGGDGGVEALIKALTAEGVPDLNTLRSVYYRERRFEFETRRNIANQLEEVLNNPELPQTVARLAPLRRDITEHPRDAPLRFALGDALVEVGLYQEALDHLDKAIEYGLRNSEVFLDKGIVLAAQNDAAGAIAEFRKALELDQDHELAWLCKGRQHMALEEYQKAEDDFTKVIVLNPVHPDTFWLRAVARYQQEKIDSAIEDFKQAALINPDPPDIIMYMAYAEALLKKGEPKDALRQIDEALKRGYADDALLAILANELENEELREFNGLIESYGVSFAKIARFNGLQIDKFEPL